MRIILFLAATFIFFASCKKDDFNTVPAISYKSINPNSIFRAPSDPDNGPVLTFHLTDSEGDFGRLNDTTISYIYVKNITAPPYKLDSFQFPAMPGLDKKNLDVDVSVQLYNVISSPLPPTRPDIDTLFFEVYVKDLARNKSNVIITGDPVYFITP